MKETCKIFGTYLLILLFILAYNNIFSQNRFCKQEICVVEFNADWNKANSVAWLDSLVNCEVTRILITDAKMLVEVKDKYNIKYVPTIIIFNGEEIERFQACLRFKMGVKLEDVQTVINNAL
jgi:hypothetical protein